MAANDGFIDYLSPTALADLKAGNAEVLKTISYIDTLNQKMASAKTPSGSNAANAELLAQLKAQDEAIKKLQPSYDKLAEAQRKKAPLDREQVINNRIQNQQTDLLIKSNSALAGAYANLSAKEAIAARNLQNLIAAGKSATQTQKQFDNELKVAQKEFDKYRAKILQADAATGRWGRSNFRTIDSVRNLMGAFGVVGGVTLFAAVSRDIFNTTRELQSLELALTQVTGGEEEAAKAQAFLSDIAEKYGVEIKQLTKSYTQFYVSAKDKLSGEEIQGIFSSISKAAGAMGLSVDQQEGAFLALTQMLSKGTIQAEELRGQLSERLPGAFGILAKSMGVTEEVLGDMLKKGQVLAADVLPAFAKELEKAYNIENLERVESLNAATTRLSNTWTDFIASLNEGDNAFAQLLTKAINSIELLLKATGNLFTSHESDRQNMLKSLRKKGLDDYKAYQGELDAARKEEVEGLKKQGGEALAYGEELEKNYEKQRETELNNTREYIKQKIAEEQKFVEMMRAQGEVMEANKGRNANGSESRQSQMNIIKNNQQIERRNNLIAKYQGELQAVNDILKGEVVVQKKLVELTDKEREALEKLRQERLKNRYEREISDLERRKKLAEDLFEEENQYADAKISRSKKIFDIEYALETRKFVESLRLHKNSLDLQAIDANNFRTATEEAEKRNEDRITKIQLEAAEERAENRKKFKGEGLNLFEDLPSGEDFWEQQEKDIESFSQALRELRDEMKDTFTSFQSEFFDSAGFSQLFKILNGEIAGFGRNFKKEFEEIERLKRNGSLTDEEAAAKGAEINSARRESAFATGLAISEAFQEAYNFISQVQQQQFEAQYNRLEREKEVALAFAGESTEARAEIERQYDERRKQIARQQAEAEKRNAIFNIAIDIAQGVAATIAKLGFPAAIPFIAAIGAIGAAQIALVASQPIPEFAVGTQDAPLGFAKVDERGAEIHTDKHGNIKSMGSDKGANIRWLEKGDKIFTADQSKNIVNFNKEMNGILSNNGISSPFVINNGMSEEAMARAMSAAISRMPEGDTILISESARGREQFEIKQGLKRQNMNDKKIAKAKRIRR